MRDITNNKTHNIDFSFDKPISETSTIILNDGDSINFPIHLPFNEEICDKNLNYIKKLIMHKKIQCPNQEQFTLTFNFCDMISFDYNQWASILTYAKKNHIQFKINEKEEYTPKEMKNYIDKFTKFDKKGKREFIFKSSDFKLSSNHLYDTTYDTEIIKDEENCVFFIDSKVKKEHFALRMFNVNKIILVLPNGSFDNKLLNHAKKIIQALKEFYPNKYIDIYFSSRHQYYKKDDFKNLLKFEDFVKKHYNKDYELKFHSGCNVVYKSQILNANNKISSVVNYLKHSKLSPYEKILYVHKLITEKEFYKDRNVDQDPYAALNSRGIVCITYCSIFKAIFDELNDPNIKAEIQLYDYKHNDNSLHAANIVYLKDRKYNIEGYYDLDITLNQGKNSLNQFMVPAGDLMHKTTHKKTRKVPFDNLSTVKRVSYFIKRNLSNIDYIDDNIDSFAIRNTNKFLSTPMGDKAILFSKGFGLKFLYESINKCIDKTTTIPIETTKKALEKVANYCFKLNEEEAKEYAKSTLLETIFLSIFYCDRKKCKNDFARKSLDIEQEKIDLLKSKEILKKIK